MKRILLALLLLPALVLTALRLWQPTSRWGIEAVPMSPAAILLYGLGAVFCCLRLGMTRNARWGVPALVCLLGAGLHGYWLMPQFTGPNPPPAAGATPLRIMTINVSAGRADTAQIVQLASSRHVDVLVVEEVTTPALAGLAAAGLDALMPNRAGAPADSPIGTMVFSHFPLQQSQPLPMNFDNWRVGVGTQPPITLDAVHVTAPVLPQDWAADLKALASERPTLMVGDFNATQDHAAFRKLTTNGLYDAAERSNAGWQPTWPAKWPLFAIDHVLVQRQWAVLSTRTFHVDGTDHLALLATIAAK